VDARCQVRALTSFEVVTDERLRRVGGSAVAESEALTPRQEWADRRRDSVRMAAGPLQRCYEVHMPDAIFVLLVLGFFAIAVLLVRACELIIGREFASEELREQ
jgi:hypothetical protein